MPIPKIIWQTYSSEKENLPNYLKAISSTWENSGLEYRYISNREACEIIIKDHGERLGEIINYANIPMVKADIMRAAIMYTYGGLYADIDTILKTPVESWIDFDKDLFLIERPGDHSLIKNDLFAFSKENIIMKSILDEIVRRCKTAILNKEEIYPYHTGPEVYEYVIKNFNIEALRSSGLNSIEYQSNYIHINGLTLKDNIDFSRHATGKKSFDFCFLNDLYADFDMTKADVKIYIKKSGYGS